MCSPDRTAPLRSVSGRGLGAEPAIAVPAAAGLLLAYTPGAAAHTEIRPTPDTLWSVWEVDLLLAIGMLVAMWLYLRGTARLWRRAGTGRGVRRWQVWVFAGAIASVAIARLSPLDALGGALFSAHMVQHLIVFLAAPLLFAASRPLLPMLWAMPASWRHRTARWAARSGLMATARSLNQWVVVFLLYAGVLWLWHVPSLYDAALESGTVHDIEHLSFAVAAYLFWASVLSAGRPGGVGHGVALLMVFATALHSSALGALLTFADTPLYASHTVYTAAWGLTPLEDQQLAGVIMWVPMGLWLTVTALVLVARWITAAGESVRRLERDGAFIASRPDTGEPPPAPPTRAAAPGRS